jgi:hypothetical protein
MTTKENKYFLEELYPSIEKSLQVPSNSNQLQNYIRSYIDKNSDVLFDKSPSKRLYFRESDMDIIFKHTDITSVQAKNVIMKNDLVGATWIVLNNPFFWVTLLAVRYYCMQKKEKEMYQTLTYLSLGLYSSLQYKYFRYGANDNIMNYAINNLSNKFYLKKYGTIFKALFETIRNNHEKYEPELREGGDIHLQTYISALRTRINSLVKNIADAYYTTKEKGLYLNTEKDNFNDEEHYHEVDNISFQVNKIADKSTNRVLTGGVDEKFLGWAAKFCGVSHGAVKTAIYNIMDKKSHEVRDFSLLILQMYLVDGQFPVESIASKNFILQCMAAYNKSNTVDPTILKMKDILDTWLTECSVNYVKTERVATKSNFRKSIFMYFVFVIQASYMG